MLDSIIRSNEVATWPLRAGWHDMLSTLLLLLNRLDLASDYLLIPLPAPDSALDTPLTTSLDEYCATEYPIDTPPFHGRCMIS